MSPWWLLAACGMREIPAHLRPDPPAAQGAVLPAPTDLSQLLALLLAGDPLARGPAPLPRTSWAHLEGAGPLLAWEAHAQGGALPEALNTLEREQAGTAAVGLIRGGRLAQVEALLPRLYGDDPAAHQEALRWLSPVVQAIGPVGGQRPWAWLGEDPLALLRYGEGWVLRGWLDGPSVPLAPVAQALGGVAYDRLALRFEGQLLLARTRSAPGPTPPLPLLETLLDLSLERAFAERDAEQEAHRARCDTLAVQLGASAPEPGRSDPLPALALRARDQALGAAQDPRAVGAALLAHSLYRWLDGRCAECPGLDRSASTRAAARWSPALEPWARLTRLVQLKLAADRFEVGLQHGRFTEGATLLADALLGQDAGVLEQSWLERRAPAPGTWLSLSRALGAVDTTEQALALRALHERIHAEALALAALPWPEGWANRLNTMARRAQRRATEP